MTFAALDLTRLCTHNTGAMRFRASVERDHFQILLHQVKILNDVGKQAVVTLSPDAVKFTMAKEDDAMQTFATVAAEGVFSEYRIESKLNNVIGVELLLGNLLHALRSGINAQTTTIRLTKRGAAPFLSVTAQTVEGGVDVLQDVPVRVLTAAELERYGEPMMPPPAVKLTMSSLKPFAAVADRMKSVSKSMRVEASQAERTVVLGVRNEAVALRTFFRDLVAEEVDEADRSGGMLAVNVSLKHVARLLKAMLVVESSLLLCVVPGHAVILHAENADHTASTTFLLAPQDVGATADAE